MEYGSGHTIIRSPCTPYSIYSWGTIRLEVKGLGSPFVEDLRASLRPRDRCDGHARSCSTTSSCDARSSPCSLSLAGAGLSMQLVKNNGLWYICL